MMNLLDETLKIVKGIGKNWWLERHEYDGAEWWEFKQVPKKNQRNIINLILL